jgi:type IV pilus assembly protein PilB
MLTPIAEQLEETFLALKQAANPNESAAIRVVNTVLLYAIQDGVEEVRLTPQSDSVSVKCRVGSTWHDWVKMPLEAQNPVLDRLKVMRDMAIDERKPGQEGHICVLLESNEYHIHTLTTPTNWGESITLCINPAPARVS